MIKFGGGEALKTSKQLLSLTIRKLPLTEYLTEKKSQQHTTLFPVQCFFGEGGFSFCFAYRAHICSFRIIMCDSKQDMSLKKHPHLPKSNVT